MNVTFEVDDGRGAVAFEWNAAKASENIRKHGISFEEVATIFLNDVLTVEDTSSHGERREISLGALGDVPSATVVVCVVHTDRNGNIRIISARKATAREKRRYEAHFTRTHR